MFQKGDCIILPEIHPDASLRALRRCLCRSGLPQTTNCRARHSAGVRCGTRRCTCFRRCEGFRTGTRFRWYRSSGGCNSLRTIFAHTLPVIPCRLATTGWHLLLLKTKLHAACGAMQCRTGRRATHNTTMHIEKLSVLRHLGQPILERCNPFRMHF